MSLIPKKGTVYVVDDDEAARVARVAHDAPRLRVLCWFMAVGAHSRVGGVWSGL